MVTRSGTSVSVVIPAFNHENFVVQALSSILESGLPSVEIIIGDDASADATVIAIRNWAEMHSGKLARFIFIERPRGIGLCASLNELVGHAQGDIIHMLASDDYFLPDGLAKKTEAMLENPQWDYVFCDGQAVGFSGEIFAPSLLAAGNISQARVNSNLAAEELLYHWEPPANLHSWRSRAFRSHGGDFEFDPTVFCEDLDAAWWALSRQKLGFVPPICQAYRHRSWPQTSTRNPSREYRDVAFILAKNAKHFEQPIAAAMMNKAHAYFNSVIGEFDMARRLWDAHAENHRKYLEKCKHVPAF